MKFLLYFLIVVLPLGLIAQEQETEEPKSMVDKSILVESLTEENADKFNDFLSANLNNEEGFVALQRIIEPFIKQKDWESAVAMLDEYKKDFPAFKARIEKLIKILNSPSTDLIEVNLGDSLNSKADEYSPLPSADKSTIYFTGFGRDLNNQTEDIFQSDFKDGAWQQSYRIPDSINTVGQESPQSISTDGNQLILFGNFKGSLGKGDLFYSEKVKDTTDPRKYRWSGIKHYPKPINSEYFDCDAKLSADGRSILFVSDRPRKENDPDFHRYNELHRGSMQGNTDIYITFKKDDDTWSEPINLGKAINTPFAERKPFLHPDGRSLYFASEGHAGLGRLDLFKATRLKNDSWTEWSEPVNLGKEINTTGDDRGAIVSTEGDLAYFAASNRGSSRGGSDIFTMTLPEYAKPEQVAMISGFVKSNKSKALDAEIVWEDLEKGEKLGNLKSSPADGKYFFAVPLGKNYGFYAKRKGYFPISRNIDLRKEKKTFRIDDDIVMVSLAELIGDDLESLGSSDMSYDQYNINAKKKIAMNNLFFEYNKWNLLKSSFPELDRIVWLLDNYPIEQVEIAGFTDSVGKEDYNLTLSDKRANSVVDYLAKKGVSKEKMVAKGYGKQFPVASNETEEGRQQNRRVELRILRINKEKAKELLNEIKKDE